MKERMEKEQIDEYDTIDIIKVFRILIRRWYLVFLVVTIVTSSVVGYHATRPKKFAAQAKIRIGKFGGELLEKYNSLYSYISVKWNKADFNMLNTLNGNTHQGFKLKYSDMVVVLSVKKESASEALKTMVAIVDFVKERHDRFYREAEKTFNAISLKEEHKKLLPKYFLPSENYPTTIIQQPVTSSIPVKNRYITKIIKTFLFSFILAFVVVYIFEKVQHANANNRTKKH